MAYHWRQPDGAFDHIKVQGAGAVTNISVTGTAILIVWTSGEVRPGSFDPIVAQF